MNSFLQALRLLGFNTTIHGCRHLVEDGRHWIERVIWVGVLTAAAAGVTRSCLDVYQEYMSSPTVTSLESTQYPAWNLPFPAVSVCNVNKISRRRAVDFAKELVSSKDNQFSSLYILEILHSLGHIYDSDFSSHTDRPEVDALLEEYNLTLVYVLERLAPSCDDLLLRCRWKGRARACRELFKPVPTINGYCCVFNMLPDYVKDEEDAIAEALQATGYKSGLSIITDPAPDDYFYPVVPTYGVQVMFFLPLNRPENSNGMIEYVAGSGNEIFYSIDVFSQFSTAELGNFAPSERGCFFRVEKDPRYTSTNCLAACWKDLLLETCNCIQFFMHNPSNSKVCHGKDSGCLARAKEIFQDYMKADAELDNNGYVRSNSPCASCLPPCSNTWYEVQSSYARIETNGNDAVTTLDGLEVNRNMSSLHIYYATLDTTLYKQDVLYTRTELVSNFGGICSLFSGFSFLSLVEIVYFLTIRFFYIARETEDSPVNEVSEQSDAPPRPYETPAPYWNEIQSNRHYRWSTRRIAGHSHY